MSAQIAAAASNSGSEARWVAPGPSKGAIVSIDDDDGLQGNYGYISLSSSGDEADADSSIELVDTEA